MDETEKLGELIEQQYQTSVVKLYILANGWKKVYRLKHTGGPDWIVRAYLAISYDGPLFDVEALASVLLALEKQAYPAERVIRAVNGVSVTRAGDWQILISTFVGQALTAWQPADQQNAVQIAPSGANLDADSKTFFALGAALGQLHMLQRDRTLPRASMLPVKELAWAHTHLTAIATQVPEQRQAQYKHLVKAVQTADRYEDLPFTLIHNDCNPSNVVITPSGQIMLIDWESAGQGPAIIDVGILLSNCFSKQQLQIDHAAITAIVDGYCQYRRPSNEELERLPDAIRFFRLVLLAGYFSGLVDQTLGADELIYGATYAQWYAQYEASAEIAALARVQFKVKF